MAQFSYWKQALLLHPFFALAAFQCEFVRKKLRDGKGACEPCIGEEGSEVIVLDIFYVAVVIAFFALLWGFTRASERL